MRMACVLVAVSLSLAVPDAASSQSGVKCLDLTRPDVVRTLPSVISGSIRGLSGVPDPPLPLTVRLVSVDRSSYRFGDPIIYEVELTNSSPAAFALPTSLDERAFEHLDAVSTMSVVLEAMVGDKRESIAAIRMVGA